MLDIMSRLLFRSAALLSRTPQCFWRSSSSSSSGSTGEGVQSAERYIWVRDRSNSVTTNKAAVKRFLQSLDIAWDSEETFSFSSIQLRGSKEDIKRIAESLDREFGPGLTQLNHYRSPFEKPDDIEYFIDVTVTLNLSPSDILKNIPAITEPTYSALAATISKRGEFQTQCIIPQVTIIVKEHPPLLYGSVKSYSCTSQDSKPVINVSVTHNICNGTEVGHIVQDVIRNIDSFSSYFITLDSVSSPETVVCCNDSQRK